MNRESINRDPKPMEISINAINNDISRPCFFANAVAKGEANANASKGKVVSIPAWEAVNW